MRATALLLDIIEGAAEGPQHILLPTHLVVRQSCGAQG
jgi:DNA-binding LacI/PurR family transcriptional regulator